MVAKNTGFLEVVTFSLPRLLLSPPPPSFRFQIRYEPLNLSRLQYMIDTGRLDASQPIKMDSLYWSGAVGKVEHGVKLLGDVSIVESSAWS